MEPSFEPNIHRTSNVSPEPIRKRLFKHFIDHGITTEDELYFFIQEYCHLNISKKAICSYHQSPWSFLADMFFERVLSSFRLASRGSGKTQDLALLNFLESIFKGVEVCNASATLDQASKCYSYYLGFWNEDLFQQHIGVRRSIQSETVLANGGSMLITSGTTKGLNGQHPNKTRIDEVELIDWVTLQEGLSMSQTVTNKYGTHKGSDILTSTRKFAGGTVQRLMDEADDKHIKVYSSCVWEVIARCEHDCQAFNKTHVGDPIFKDTVVCPIYDKYNNKTKQLEPFCHGKAHDADGFIPVEEVIRKTRILDWNALDAQWLCRKPSDASAVYGEFYDSRIHDITLDEFKSRFTDSQLEEMSRRGGTDFGSNHCTTVGIIDNNTSVLPTFYLVAEHYTSDDLLNKAHVERIKNLYGYKKGMIFYGDYAQKQDIREFRYLGLNVKEANKDVFNGLEKVKQHMQVQLDMKPRFYLIRESCPMTAKQLEGYSHVLGKDGRVDRDRIMKQEDHGPDAVRYMIYSYSANATNYGGMLVKM